MKNATEKHKPHTKLAVVKSIVTQGNVRATASAYSGAQLLGIETLADMCALIMSLESSNFHKSMTTHADHRIWQDVYHSRVGCHGVYLKLTVIEDVLIVSFKEL